MMGKKAAWTCTDPDCYQWQNMDKYGFNMCQVVAYEDMGYSVRLGCTIDPREYEFDVKEIASFFGYNPDMLLSNEALFAECIFEYCSDDFAENPYGLSPLYDTYEKACNRCDMFMQELSSRKG